MCKLGRSSYPQVRNNLMSDKKNLQNLHVRSKRLRKLFLQTTGEKCKNSPVEKRRLSSQLVYLQTRRFTSPQPNNSLHQGSGLTEHESDLVGLGIRAKPAHILTASVSHKREHLFHLHVLG